MAVHTLDGQVGSGVVPASGLGSGVLGVVQVAAQPHVPLVRLKQAATSPAPHFGRALSGHSLQGVVVSASPVPIRASRSAQPSTNSKTNGAAVLAIFLVWKVMA